MSPRHSPPVSIGERVYHEGGAVARDWKKINPDPQPYLEEGLGVRAKSYCACTICRF